MDEQPYYDAVARELENRSIKPGLWARAVAETGDEGGKARALYIRLRVAELKQDKGSETGPAAEQKARVTLKEVLQDVKTTPSLQRRNGTGFTLLGKLTDPNLAPMYFTHCFYTFLWLPVSSSRIYLVTNPINEKGRPQLDRYQFHGELDPKSLQQLYDKDTLRQFRRTVRADAVFELGFVIFGILVVSFLAAVGLKSCAQ